MYRMYHLPVFGKNTPIYYHTRSLYTAMPTSFSASVYKNRREIFEHKPTHPTSRFFLAHKS